MKNRIKSISLSLIFLTSFACGNAKKSSENQTSTTVVKSQVFVPEFNADSAYIFIEKQLEFGPRTPESESHQQCAEYLTNTLKRYTNNVIVQEFKSRRFDGKILNGKNIIASFQSEKRNRVLLAAHWDSRPFADQDPDPTKKNNSIQGANDGASGVGVLLEIARQLSMHETSPGIDILFFDLEDSGESGNNDSWALGSQYWSRNPHQINYMARYGILLDMVGATDPVFAKEVTSMRYAPGVMNMVWDKAAKLGYADYFKARSGGSILDDHVAINENLNIPTIDIIDYDENSSSGFFEHWHTTLDNLDIIDPLTLKIVGRTVLTVIFEEK